jgi:Tfp pilus assembly protein PilX
MKHGVTSLTLSRHIMRGATTRKKQKGAVLIIVLMLLLVMTVLAVSGVGNSVLEQKMSGNYYHSATAFEAAEFGLRVAEQWMYDHVKSSSPWKTWFTTDTTETGLYTTQDASEPNSVEVCGGDIDCQFDPRIKANWCHSATSGCVLPKGYAELGTKLLGTLPNEKTLEKFTMVSDQYQPRFIIEYIGAVKDPCPEIPCEGSGSGEQQAFRITVIGWGQEGVSRHVVQSHVLVTI